MYEVDGYVYNDKVREMLEFMLDSGKLEGQMHLCIFDMFFSEEECAAKLREEGFTVVKKGE